MNLDKTKILHFRRESQLYNPFIFSLLLNEIEIVDQYKYPWIHPKLFSSDPIAEKLRAEP